MTSASTPYKHSYLWPIFSKKKLRNMQLTNVTFYDLIRDVINQLNDLTRVYLYSPIHALSNGVWILSIRLLVSKIESETYRSPNGQKSRKRPYIVLVKVLWRLNPSELKVENSFTRVFWSAQDDRTVGDVVHRTAQISQKWPWPVGFGFLAGRALERYSNSIAAHYAN